MVLFRRATWSFSAMVLSLRELELDGSTATYNLEAVLVDVRMLQL